MRIGYVQKVLGVLVDMPSVIYCHHLAKGKEFRLSFSFFRISAVLDKIPRLGYTRTQTSTLQLCAVTMQRLDSVADERQTTNMEET